MRCGICFFRILFGGLSLRLSLRVRLGLSLRCGIGLGGGLGCILCSGFVSGLFGSLCGGLGRNLGTCLRHSLCSRLGLDCKPGDGVGRLRDPRFRLGRNQSQPLGLGFGRSLFRRLGFGRKRFSGPGFRRSLCSGVGGGLGFGLGRNQKFPNMEFACARVGHHCLGTDLFESTDVNLVDPIALSCRRAVLSSINGRTGLRERRKGLQERQRGKNCRRCLERPGCHFITFSRLLRFAVEPAAAGREHCARSLVHNPVRYKAAADRTLTTDYGVSWSGYTKPKSSKLIQVGSRDASLRGRGKIAPPKKADRIRVRQRPVRADLACG